MLIERYVYICAYLHPSASVKKIHQAKYGISHVKSLFGHLFVYMSVDFDYICCVLVVLAISNLATRKPGLRCFPPSHVIPSVLHCICSLSTRLWLNHEISSKFRKQSSATSDCFHYTSDSSPVVPILYKPFQHFSCILPSDIINTVSFVMLSLHCITIYSLGLASILLFYHRQQYLPVPSPHTMPHTRTKLFYFHDSGSLDKPLTPPTLLTPNPLSPGTHAPTDMLATTEHVITTVFRPATSSDVVPTQGLASLSPPPIPGLPIVGQGFPHRSSPLGLHPRILSFHPVFPCSGPKPNLYRLALIIRSAKAAAKNPSTGPMYAWILSLPNISILQAETVSHLKVDSGKSDRELAAQLVLPIKYCYRGHGLSFDLQQSFYTYF
jgi:hypothetical protein